jgi:putative FmdB family regulatory protein
MPLYEFRCVECGRHLTLGLTFQEFERQLKTLVCPICASRHLELVTDSDREAVASGKR